MYSGEKYADYYTFLLFVLLNVQVACFFSPSFFCSSLYLVHSFCLTKRKGEARKRSLTCYLVSSCPTHFSGGTGLQTIITDECFPFPIIPNWLVSSIAAVKKKKNLNWYCYWYSCIAYAAYGFVTNLLADN